MLIRVSVDPFGPDMDDIGPYIDIYTGAIEGPSVVEGGQLNRYIIQLCDDENEDPVTERVLISSDPYEEYGIEGIRSLFDEDLGPEVPVEFE